MPAIRVRRAVVALAALAAVYGIALAAVGRSDRFKVSAALASGVFQLALGLLVLAVSDDLKVR